MATLTPCYADQKFNEALQMLALTNGSIRERLIAAYVWLAPILHQDDQIPPGLEEKWAKVRGHKPLATLSDEEAKDLAETIVEVARKVSFWSRSPPKGWQCVWPYLEG